MLLMHAIQVKRAKEAFTKHSKAKDVTFIEYWYLLKNCPRFAIR